MGPTLLSAAFDSGFLAQEYKSKYEQLQYPQKSKINFKSIFKSTSKQFKSGGQECPPHIGYEVRL